MNCPKTILKFTLKLILKQPALPDDGVTAPKHVGAVLMLLLMQILKFFLRQFTCASFGELKTL